MSIFKFGKFDVVEVVGGYSPFGGDTGTVIKVRGNLIDGIEYCVSLEKAELDYWFDYEDLRRVWRDAPAAVEPTADGSAEDDDSDEVEPLELSIHRMIPGLWRLTHKDGVSSMELVSEDGATASQRDSQWEYNELVDRNKELIAQRKALESDLARVRSERDAAVAALEPFAELYRDWLVNRKEIEFFDYLNRYRVSDEVLSNVMNASVAIQEAQQALQAAAPASGEEGA